MRFPIDAAKENFGNDARAYAAEYRLTRRNSVVMQVNGTNRFVENAEHLNKADYMDITMKSYTKAIEALRAQGNVPVYIYLVETPAMLPVDKPVDSTNEFFYLYLSMALDVDGIAQLEATDADQLLSYFYSTDKHWNYRGSYRGYLDCVKLLGITEEPVQIDREVDTGVVYNGSLAQDVKDPISDETFSVYTFTGVPEFKATIGGKQKKYGRVDDYLAGKINKQSYTDHYSLYYGGNYGTTILDSAQSGKPKLLIIGNSFSNAVRTLLTKHYDRIVDIDLRYNESFSLTETVKKYDIDQVLFLSDAWMYVCGVTMKP